jgi:hypothetical protein
LQDIGGRKVRESVENAKVLKYDDTNSNLLRMMMMNVSFKVGFISSGGGAYLKVSTG